MGAKLTSLGVKALVKPGRYSDGDGLHFHVRSAERRAWVFRYTRFGHTRDMGLGPFPDVSLADARKAAAAARLIIREGGDPLTVRQKDAAAQQKVVRNFEAAATYYIESHKDGWKNAKHADQWLATLTTYAFPVIGKTPVDQIDVDAVLRILRPMWTKTPETATRVRGRIEAVLDAAKARGWRAGENPARWKGTLAGLLPPRARVAKVEHQPALAWKDIGAFMTELGTVVGIAARALEFVILTATRTGEVRGARWSEIDLDGALWVVPAIRMKAGVLYRVPLSTAAVTLLRDMRNVRVGDSALVFPGGKADKPLSDMALAMVVRRMNEAAGGEIPKWRDISGRAIVPHGFRSTFRVWAGEQTRYPREVVEAALAHTLRDKVEAAYARTDLLERRRPLMEDWGKHCRLPMSSGPNDSVVIDDGEKAPRGTAQTGPDIVGGVPS